MAHWEGKKHLVSTRLASARVRFRSSTEPLHDQLSGDAGKRAGAQWWCDDRVAEDQEDVAPLRFALVLRYRPDKSAAEADTIETVKELGVVVP
jgi:hypothetical protein